MRKNNLRVFAGPNGSGKSTLFNVFNKLYNPGYFINADELEKLLKKTSFIDLKQFEIKANSTDFRIFNKRKDARSLVAKATSSGYKINLHINDNCLTTVNKKTNSYEASQAAAFVRWMLIKKGKSFSFESVMSNESKVREIAAAKRKGFKIYLYFVCIDDPQINISRVADRIRKGGHAVNADKIKKRYDQTLENLGAAISLARRVYLFDNSGKKLELIAEIFEGVLQLRSSQFPQWFVNYVLPHFKP